MHRSDLDPLASPQTAGGFRRPLLATIFYRIALGLGVLTGAAFLLALINWNRTAMDFLMIFRFPTGLLLTLQLAAYALLAVAFGYIIELLARIEWNTRR